MKPAKIIIFLFFISIFGFIFVSRPLANSDNIAIPITCPNSGLSINPNTIIPKPQKITLGCDTVNINSNWKIFTNTNDEYENFTANYLLTKIKETSSSTINPSLSNLTNVSDINQIPDYSIIIGNPNENNILKSLASKYGIDFKKEITKGFDQGYILLIKPKQILILANSTSGTFYGTVSLTWLLRMNKNAIQLPESKISDWPDLDIRGWHGKIDKGYIWGGKPITTEEKWFDILTKYKYNMWTYGIPSIESDSTQDYINRSLDLKNYSRLRHFRTTSNLPPLEVITINPNYNEGFYAKNIDFKFNSSNRLVSRSSLPVNLIKNPDFEDDSDNNNFPDYWRYTDNSNKKKWSWDCNEKYSGKCSVKLTFSKRNESDGNTFLYSSNINSSTTQTYNLLPNRAYSLSFYTKTKHPTDDSSDPNLSIQIEDANGNPIRTASYNRYLAENNNTWRKHAIKFTTSNNETFISLRAQSKSGSILEFWLDNLQLIDLTDKLKGVIETPDSSLHIWNDNRTIEYIKDKDYKIINYGSINPRFPDEADTMVVERITNGNISKNANVKVDYDFAINIESDRSSLGLQSLSDPYGIDEYTSHTIGPTMKTIDPEYVLIAMDELRGINRDSRAQKRNLSNYQVLATYLNNLSNKIKAYNPNIKILVWDDMISPLHNGGRDDYQINFGGKLGKTWYSLDLLNKNLIPISWRYGTIDPNNKMTGSSKLYEKYGFKYMVASWNDETNIKWWSYLSNNTASGLIACEWGSVLGDLINASNYSWNTVKKQSTTNLTTNIEICDGKDNDGDGLYWEGQGSFSQKNWRSLVDEGFDLQNDPFNCGKCGNICYAPHSHYSCIQGKCHFDKCYSNYENRNNDLSDGCEVGKAKTPSPTQTPSSSPTKTPSSSPTKTPSSSPTQTPSSSPTQTPSISAIKPIPDQLNLKIDESRKINIETEPKGLNVKIQWTSENASIAKVYSNGTVKGIKDGETTIRAKVKDKDIRSNIKVKVLKKEETTTDAKVSFKISFRGISAGAKCLNTFVSNSKLKLDIANVPSNKFDTGVQTSFKETDKEVEELINGMSVRYRVFQVDGLSLDNKFATSNNFNFIKVKGPAHLKQKMCQDGQNKKTPESTICEINLNASNTKIYDFSKYYLLPGDINLDGVINTIDLNIVKKSLKPGVDVGCIKEGDLNLDGVINTFDLNLVKDSLLERDDE